MKRLMLALLFAGVSATHLAAQTDAEFKQKVQDYWKTWSHLDPDLSAAMYDKNADLVFFDVTPMKYKGWSEYAAGVKKSFGGMKSAEIKANDDITVSRHGNWAWTTDTFTGVLTDKDGKTSPLNGRHTAIWQKTNGKWLIVHDHVSVPMAD